VSTEHPITPPNELAQQWYRDAEHQLAPYYVFVARCAAQWGADQQLEATDTWIRTEIKDRLRPANRIADDHRADMRPQPPSLKERSLQLLETYNTSGVMLTADQADTIRQALEALDD
jgi:hypothetical protein